MGDYGQAGFKAVQTVGVGVAAGVMIEALMPQFNESEPKMNIWMDVVGHLVLNGVAIVVVQGVISNNDPTGGGLFFPALMIAQPSLRDRIRWSSTWLTNIVEGALKSPIEPPADKLKTSTP